MKEFSEKSNVTKVFSGVFASILFFIVVMISGLFGARAFAAGYRFYPVKGISMQPYINPDIYFQEQIQDGVLVHVGQKPKFNDVVIIKKAPKNDLVQNETTIIKRIIASEGDYVTVKKNTSEPCMHSESGCNYYHVFLVQKGDTKILNETYVERYDRWTNEVTAEVVGSVSYEGKFYSTFFSVFAPQHYREHVENIEGSLYYQLQQGEYFYMGDNRYCSKDARADGVAYSDEVVGVVVDIIRNIVDDDKSTVDNVVYKENLWWLKLKSSVSYLFSRISDFFDWK